MTKLNYANASSQEAATGVLFGANTRHAGTAPTYVDMNNKSLFSADVIREVDNLLYSLPENFKLGDKLWDDGNLPLNAQSSTAEVEAVALKFTNILKAGKSPICLGGDHVIKYAALAALDKTMPDQYGVVYLDAHPDCERQDNLSYSSILHHGFLLPSLKPRQIMLTGVRQFTDSEASALQSYLPEIGLIKGSEFASINMEKMASNIVAHFSGLKYLYFSFDLDGLSPADAPAIESPYPGGPNLNQVIMLMHLLQPYFKFAGMDVSEFVPELDDQHITALSAARLAKEFYSLL